MIGRLKGFLIEKSPPKLILDVGGLGYEVDSTTSTFEALPPVGTEVILYVHLTVREDAHLLYGFLTLDDRNLFRLLITINGIGPKMALGILSAVNVRSLMDIVQTEDAGRLTQIPGIGKKTAERLMIELRDKLSKFIVGSALDIEYAGERSHVAKPRAISEAIQALISLGYKPQEATTRIEKLHKAQPGLSSEEMIRQALQAYV